LGFNISCIDFPVFSFASWLLRLIEHIVVVDIEENG